MATIGARLREARELDGRSLAEMSTQTRISVRHLEAIEADEWGHLPGGFFARSFVTQYAGALGLDRKELSEELDQVVPAARGEAPPPQAARLGTERGSAGLVVSREPLASRMWFRLGLLVGMVAVCTGVYAMWERDQRARLTPPEPAASANPTPAPAAAQPTAAVVQPTEEVPPAAPVAADATGAAVPTPESTASPTESSLAIRVTAKEQAWFSLAADGQQVFNGTLEAGEVRDFAASGAARMLVGNAGGVDVSVNGNPVGEVGPRGQVRIVTFSPAGAEITKPVRKPAVAEAPE